MRIDKKWVGQNTFQHCRFWYGLMYGARPQRSRRQNQTSFYLHTLELRQHYSGLHDELSILQTRCCHEPPPQTNRPDPGLSSILCSCSGGAQQHSRANHSSPAHRDYNAPPPPPLHSFHLLVARQTPVPHLLVNVSTDHHLHDFGYHMNLGQGLAGRGWFVPEKISR